MTPIPSTTLAGRLACARMPATFAPSSSTSFGSLIDAPGPIAPATASAATSVSSGQRLTGGGGLRTTENVSPEPGASIQTRSRRPRPCGLVLGERNGAVRRVLRRQLLGRRGLDGVVVRPAEGAAQPRLDDVGRKWHGY